MMETRIPLRWRDMDELGHLTHSVYHDFLAEGRVALMETILPRDAFPYVLASVQVDYRHEVRRTDGEVVVRSWIERLGSKSVTIAHHLELPDGTRCAEGTATLVAWDAERRASRELDAEERAGLERLRG